MQKKKTCTILLVQWCKSFYTVVSQQDTNNRPCTILTTCKIQKCCSQTSLVCKTNLAAQTRISISHVQSYQVKRLSISHTFLWNVYQTGRPSAFMKQHESLRLQVTNGHSLHEPSIFAVTELSYTTCAFVLHGMYSPPDCLTLST